MANTNNNSVKTRNVVEIIGRVKENKLQVDKDKVNGSLVIEYGKKVEDQVEVKIYVNSKKDERNKDGEKTGSKIDNPTYEKAIEWSNYTSLATATEENPAEIVRIYNSKPDFAPVVKLNEYESNGEVISNPEVSIGFAKVFKSNFAEEQFKGEFDMIVYLNKNPRMEIKNGEETGRLIVEGLMIEHNGAVKPLTFMVEDEELIEGLTECTKGETVNIWGSCQVAEITEIKEKKSGFGGKAKTDTKTFTQRQLLIQGGDPIEEDDKRAIDGGFIKKALLERETFLEELKKGKEKETTPKTKGGFGGTGTTSKASKVKDGDIPF